MAQVLLINPSYSPSYGGTKVSVVNPIYPTLGLATIAATALERGHKVQIRTLLAISSIDISEISSADDCWRVI